MLPVYHQPAGHFDSFSRQRLLQICYRPVHSFRSHDCPVPRSNLDDHVDAFSVPDVQSQFDVRVSMGWVLGIAIDGFRSPRFDGYHVSCNFGSLAFVPSAEVTAGRKG